MADLIHTVADLIEERDREGLEATLTRALFELSGARELTIWRVRRRGDGVWLKRGGSLPTDLGEELRPLRTASEPLRAAFESRNLVRLRDPREGLACCVLPVLGGGAATALIEILTAAELDRERLTLLGGLLRIYRSHLAALDYGDLDELTRLANRRTFDDEFGRFALGEARRRGARRAGDDWTARAHLGVADIDFFKQVNDRFGHPYGDEVLVLFAGLMRDTFRETDRLFRFGGEEFVILMAQCGVEDALAAFERFRAAVEAHHFPQVGRVTVSVGATSLRLDDTGSAAFGRADQALYVAKRRGRNRVLCFEDLHDSPALEALRKPTPEVELF